MSEHWKREVATPEGIVRTMGHRHAVSNAGWERIEGLLPGRPGTPRRPAEDNRLFIDAVLRIAKTGSPWRDLPGRSGDRSPVWRRFGRRTQKGVRRDLFEHFRARGAFAPKAVLQQRKAVFRGAVSYADSGLEATRQTILLWLRVLPAVRERAEFYRRHGVGGPELDGCLATLPELEGSSKQSLAEWGVQEPALSPAHRVRFDLPAK
ncbi:MAG: transposase [Gemmataceae bacterium]|nr:transposase [Gemmataceae bacterium]